MDKQKDSELDNDSDEKTSLPDQSSDAELVSDSDQPKRKRRVKVRRRVRVKKKTSPQKRARKLMENIIWVIIIGAFITTLIMLMRQMDLNSKSSTKKKTTALFFPSNPNTSALHRDIFYSGLI